MSKFKVEIGDKVGYSVAFLRSIGMAHSDMARGRGVVTDVRPFGSHSMLATIDWGGVDLPERVNVANLAKVGPNTRFCAV